VDVDAITSIGRCQKALDAFSTLLEYARVLRILLLMKQWRKHFVKTTHQRHHVFIWFPLS
jgi:hypothetical protein